jgi:hypothetical protein
MSRTIAYDGRRVVITFLSERRFRLEPQVGRTIDRTWRAFQESVSHPRFANRKDAHGAWYSCAIEGGIIKRGTGPHHVIGTDVDRRVEGVDRTARVLAHATASRGALSTADYEVAKKVATLRVAR